MIFCSFSSLLLPRQIAQPASSVHFCSQFPSSFKFREQLIAFQLSEKTNREKKNKNVDEQQREENNKYNRVMEGAEKRKERLKAMCTGAQNASLPAPQNNLVNPLNQVNSNSIEDSSLAIPRFDYYTDPMAVFHGNRRDVNVNHTWRNNVHNHPGSFRSSSPSFQTGPRQQSYRLANHNQPGSLLPPPPPFEIQGAGPRQQPYGSVMYNPANCNQPGFSLPPPAPFQIQAGPRQQPYMSVMSTPANVNQPGSFLPPPPSLLPPSCDVRGTTWITSPHLSDYDPRKGHTFGINSRDSRWKSKQECAKSLYNREMINDPWRFLKPCPGNILKPFTSLGNTAPGEWITKPNVTKKPKVDITLNKPTSSIAEYIAQSFEATKDVKNT